MTSHYRGVHSATAVCLLLRPHSISYGYSSTDDLVRSKYRQRLRSTLVRTSSNIEAAHAHVRAQPRLSVVSRFPKKTTELAGHTHIFTQTHTYCSRVRGLPRRIYTSNRAVSNWSAPRENHKSSIELAEQIKMSFTSRNTKTVPNCAH